MTKWWRNFIEGVIVFSLIFILISVWLVAIATFIYWGFVPIDWVYFRIWCVIIVAVTILISFQYANFYSK